MNREQLMNASNEELDNLCFQHILTDADKRLWHEWHLYTPSTDISQAVQMLEQLKRTRKVMWQIGTHSATEPYAVILEWDGVNRWMEYHGKPLSRTIVIACLLAVAVMGKQP